MGNADTPLHRFDAQQQAQDAAEDAREAVSLNRRIAEALGWTGLEWTDEDVDPCGMSVIPKNAWLGVNPQGRRAYVPDYLHSLDAVLAELPPNGTVEFYWVESHYEARVKVVGGDTPYYTNRVERSATRQEAAARALLAYVEWKAKQT